ncbi:hypothetical protein NDU88_009417 [Pleurodeles waltl]|uniref:Uncharacterized protein n=1 Tax=Pleurodeles waltl TaxID=8319 RepID=A0AAV7QRG6_PLEWA|nr:hypothetical protein NDU88_009417 [Pleurodeles waltl]
MAQRLVGRPSGSSHPQFVILSKEAARGAIQPTSSAAAQSRPQRGRDANSGAPGPTAKDRGLCPGPPGRTRLDPHPCWDRLFLTTRKKKSPCQIK